MKKKQALVKNEMERRMAEFVKFSKSFKVRDGPYWRLSLTLRLPISSTNPYQMTWYPS